MVDYASLFSRNLPRSVATPEGASAQVKYIFSVTNAVPEVIDADEYLTAIASGLEGGGAASLAGYPPAGGHVGLRELIARRLASNRGFNASPDDVFIADGAGGSITILLDSFINPGDPVLVEEFTYMGSLRMMMERGAEPIHVPSDEDGMLPDAVEDILSSLDTAGRRAKFIWTIPVFQNPLGFTVSEARRNALLDVAERWGVPILENESYADFRIDGDPLPPAMSGMRDNADVMYVSSFTKLLGCGLRVGFGVLPPAVKAALPLANAENLPRRNASHLATMLVYEYMRDHEAEHIEAVRKALLVRRDAMLEALTANFPAFCEWTEPQGGMMIFVRLPEGADTWSTLVKATQRDVKYNPGGMFRSDRDRNNHFRLTYSHNSPEEIREGIARLAELFCEEGYFEG
jgi:DNA-binding transcriptional MocR family regulator